VSRRALANAIGWVVALVAVFGYLVWFSVTNLVAFAAYAQALGALGVAPGALPWVYAIALVVVPLLAAAGVLVAARGRNDVARWLVLLAGFGAASALSLSLILLGNSVA